MSNPTLLLFLSICFVSCDSLWGTTKNIESHLCPDKAGTCPDKSTCCKLNSGKYGCCPLPNAVCCSDHLHCCPSGFKCDAAQGTCSSSNLVIDWLLPIAKEPVPLKGDKPGAGLKQERDWRKDPENVECPGHRVECPSGDTCCKMGKSDYGCCPLPEAVCCTDQSHCCPKGTTCDDKAKTCKKQADQGSTLWMNLVLGRRRDDSKGQQSATPLRNVVCPGGQSYCASGQTCCKNPQGQWTCCPLQQAVCCSDNLHCCPHGYTCDVTHLQCNPDPSVVQDFALRFVPMATHVEATPVLVEEYQCPDKISTCPEKTTCCLMKNGYYGCCQYESAVCCTDMLHCCPQDMQCNVTTGECVNNMYSLKFGRPETEKALRVKAADSPILCPDQSHCPADTTCCALPDRGYGCCPFPKAQCCADHVHCCPVGQTCDDSKGECKSALDTQPWGIKFPSTPKPDTYPDTNTICPDGKSQCLGDTTCCKIGPQQYGCCNLPDAVCCADKQHCCPKGFSCNYKQGVCTREDYIVPWLEHVREETRERADLVPDSTNVLCPDGHSECSQGNTCCLLSSGQYGCCPFTNAVCCVDHIHCCPAGYTCNVQSQTCNQQNSVSVPWFSKRPALQRQVKVLTDVICPDQKSQCPAGTTCCKTTTGQYGCCPLESAVCCSDNIHCCPQGTTCDLTAGTCVSGDIRSLQITWYTTQLRQRMEISVRSVVCPGGSAQCQTGETCCKLSTGEYGCCPLPNAVCCANSDFCCPSGTTCDTTTHMCTPTATNNYLALENTDQLPWTVVQDPTPGGVTRLSVGDVVCPDKKSQCGHDQTCCKLSSGDYGCCPLPAATCCSDGIHCCPHGDTCDVTAGTCSSGTTGTIAAFTPHPVIHDVICPDKKSQCTHDQTCCKLVGGNYGCCPLPAATCCSDGIHCCPHGDTCDVTAGTCSTGATETIAASTPHPVTHDVICPDKKSQCTHDQTCCKLVGGNYGCCPLPAATCCADGLHCCPHGAQCDAKSGTCTSDSSFLTISWISLERHNALSVHGGEADLVGAVLCPDKTECPWGTTCCVSSSGKYACCSEKNASCCADKVHCCPEGYTCSATPGKCEKPGLSLQSVQQNSTPWVKKVAARPVGNTELVKLPPGCHCGSKQTCCKTQTGGYGCCPYNLATCCPDLKTCCPHGYECSTTGSTCVKK